MSIERIEKEFLAYVDSFLCGDESEDYHFLIKKEHSLRVRDICHELCNSENFDKYFRETASITALLHDIGRFEQFKLYKTFKDSDSADHGMLGV